LVGPSIAIIKLHILTGLVITGRDIYAFVPYAPQLNVLERELLIGTASARVQL
jgi:hypothetical protein